MKHTKLIAAISSCVIALGFTGAPTALAGIGGDQGGNPGNPHGPGLYQKKWVYMGRDLNHLNPKVKLAATQVYQPKHSSSLKGEITGILPKCADSDVAAIYVLMQGRGRFTPKTGFRNNAMVGRVGAIRDHQVHNWAELAVKRGTPNKPVKDFMVSHPRSLSGKNVVCIYGDDVGGKPVYEEKPVPKITPKQATVNCVGAKSVMVKRRITVDGKDPIGANNLHDQMAHTNLTAFGKQIKNFTTNPPASVDEAAAQLAAACKKAQQENPPKVNLDKDNRDGLAEGGVLDVYETETPMSFTARENIQSLKGCYVREGTKDRNGKITWKGGGDGWSKTVKPCKDKHPEMNKRTVVPPETQYRTPQTSGFWQIISAHCNKPGWNKLMGEVPGKTVQVTPDSSGKISGVAYSQKYSTVPATADFGDTGNAPGTAKHDSGTVGFYDKECPFDCTSNPTTPQAAKNGANKNIVNKKPAKDGTVDKYGAKSGKHNNNYYEFFRDNNPNGIDVDLWYPRNVNGVSYDGADALSTTVTRWEKGTPSIDGSDGGKFTMKAGKDELFTGNGNPEIQRDWEVAGFTNSTTTQLPGTHTGYTVQSTWASEKDRPQKLNFKYEYEPTVTTNFAAAGLGFDSAGNPVRGQVLPAKASIQGKCYARFATTAGKDTTQPFAHNTGSGTPNKLDGNLLSDDTTLTVNFVRSTTE